MARANASFGNMLRVREKLDGGLRIKRGEEVEGGIGVGGAPTNEHDELCARRGLFAKQKPSGAESGTGGTLNLSRERNSYENRCCSNDG